MFVLIINRCDQQRVLAASLGYCLCFWHRFVVVVLEPKKVFVFLFNYIIYVLAGLVFVYKAAISNLLKKFKLVTHTPL